MVFLYSLKLFVLDLTEEADPASASHCFNFLFNLIKQIPRLASERPDMFREYLRMLAGLKASFFLTMPLGDILDFLRENLLYSLEVIDFDIVTKIYKLLILSAKYPEVFETERKQYIKAIEQNKEMIGNDYIKTETKALATQIPTVENWLLDYNQFSVAYQPGLKGGMRPRGSGSLGGSLERVAYMQKSPNVKNLSKDEKFILFRLLELYDWLKIVKPTDQFVPIFSSYYQIGEGELDGEVEKEEPQLSNVRQVEPSTKPIPPKGPLGDKTRLELLL